MGFLRSAGKVQRGSKIIPLKHGEIKQLQRKLAKRGFDVGKIDGIPGKKTRAAVKVMQQKLGLPADSYPTGKLLAKL